MTRYFILFLFLIYSNLGFAVLEQNLKKITMQDGLSDNTVNVIHRDGDGFIWIGTDNGLNKYDGTVVTSFHSQHTNLRIAKVREGENRVLWLVANRHLLAFDREIEQFYTPYTPDLDAVEVQDSFVDTKGHLWVLSKGVLTCYKVVYKANEVALESLYQTSSTEIYIRDVAWTNTDRFIALSANNKIVRFDVNSLTYSLIDSMDELSKLQLKGMKVLDNELWIYGTSHGAYVYRLDSKDLQHYYYQGDSKTPNNLSHSDVYDIAELDKNRRIVVGWNGYTVFNPTGKDDYTTEIYNNTYSFIHRNLETHMISTFYDPIGVLYIGTLGGGLYISDLRQQFYSKYMQNSHNEICAIASDEHNFIYLGTFHKGLMKSTTPISDLSPLDFKEINIPELENNVLAIKQVGSTLWIAGRSGHLVGYDVVTDTYRSFAIRSKNKTFQGEVRAISISEGILWLGTTQGLYGFNLDDKTFTHYNLSVGSIRSILPYQDYLLLATSVGVKSFNKYVGVLEDYLPDKGTLSQGETRCLFLSTDHHLYVGYDKGLAVFCMETKELTHFFTTENGLNNNYIDNILEDRDKAIWLGTNSGITKYDQYHNSFYHYYLSGSNRSAHRCGDYLMWGNNLNLTYLDINQLTQSYSKVGGKVFITNLLLDGKSIRVNELVNRQNVVSRAVFLEDELTLNADNNSIALQFSNLQYNEQQKYQFRLLPNHSEWTVAEEGESIHFDNLPKGKYTFEVRSLSEQEKDNSVTQLTLNILPKWYETIVFKLIVLLAAMGLVAWLFFKIKQRKQRKQREQELKQELWLASMESEKERKLNAERESFFTHIAHELRTPLTLIEAPVSSILEKKGEFPVEVQKNLHLIAKNTKTLSMMVDQLLVLQKMELGFTSLKVEQFDVMELTTRLFHSFEGLAQQNKIEYQIEESLPTLNMWGDRRLIESALQNLLSNAFKYTPTQGAISLSLKRELKEEVEYVVIRVKDDGVGIEAQLQEKMFSPYITGDKMPNHSSSIGLGLQIVKHIIDLHSGEIKVDSEKDKGTCIDLYLPLGKEHFKEEMLLKGKETSLPISKEVNEEQSGITPKNTMLIIEDHADMRRYIASLFIDSYAILEAENGLQGVEMAQKHRPDIILTDIMMPVMDGFEAVNQIKSKKETADLPIIMLTAKGEDEDYIQSVHLGVDDFIKKPFNPMLLQAKVNSLVALRTRLKRLYAKSLQLNVENTSSDSPNFMQEVINIIESNLKDSDFSVKNLAEELCMSQSTLYRRLKECSDLSGKDIIRKVRITKAAALIVEGSYQIQEVAELVGYNDVESFRKHFINQFGIQPSLYKENGSKA